MNEEVGRVTGVPESKKNPAVWPGFLKCFT